MKVLKEIIKFSIYLCFYLFFKIVKITIFKNNPVFYLRAERIGNQTAEAEIFYLENIDTREKTFVFSSKPANSYFHELFIKSLKKNKKIQVFKNYLFWDFIFRSYSYFNKKTFPQRITNIRRKSNYLENEKFLELNPKETEKGYEILKKNFGIKKNDKWICIYNRDEGYLKNFSKKESFLKFSVADFSYHDFRNFPIEDLDGVINLFIKKGYFVIRMGNFTIGTSKVKNAKYIDYSKSKINSDFMDVFLFSKCYFTFGGGSGVCMLPATFRRPYFMINNTPILAVFTIYRKFPGIFKRIRDLETKEILSVQQIINRGVSSIHHKNKFIEKNVENINNSQEELLDFALEALDIVEKGPIENKSYKIKKKKLEEEIIKDQNLKDLFIKNHIGSKFLENTILE